MTEKSREEDLIPPHAHTSNETATHNVFVITNGCGRLYYHPEAEDDHVHEDGIFTRDALGKDSRVQSSYPSTEFENGCPKSNQQVRIV